MTSEELATVGVGDQLHSKTLTIFECYVEEKANDALFVKCPPIGKCRWIMAEDLEIGKWYPGVD